MDGIELVGVADTDAATARRVAEECGCAALDDPAALVGEVDAVSVVVPTTAHLAVARPFLERGVHMLLEKPIAASVEEGREIVDLARRSRAVLQVGHLERFNAGVMALAERISRPRFVEAHRMGTFVPRATDVDVVSDLMIHDIDIILSLVDAEITSIAAVGTPVLTGHIDIANARLEFENGTVANVIASRVSDRKSRRIRVFEENRYEALDFIEQRLDTAYTRPKAGSEWPEIVREEIRVEPVKPLDTELAAFVDCASRGRRPLVDGAAGLKALEVALRVKAEILAR
jgi:predicted dehydrogenase